MNELEIRVEQPLPIDLQRGAAIARQLRDYLRQARMTVRLPRGGEHVRIEGWQVLCHMCNLPLPSIVSVRREERENGYCYIAEAVLQYGGREYRAYGICASDEPNWRGKPEFQLASMAQTRAAGKVLRLLLGWIVTLAGYEPTPAEEMVHEPTPPNTPTPTAPHGGTQRRVPDPELQPPIDAPADDVAEAQAHANGDSEQMLLSQLQVQDRDRYNRVLRALQAQARQRFADDTTRRQWLHTNYGVWSFRDLTLSQARECLHLLQETPT